VVVSRQTNHIFSKRVCVSLQPHYDTYAKIGSSRMRLFKLYWKEE
jgi:hypothetical protein